MPVNLVLLEHTEEGGFIVKSVELPVASEGETKEEALSNIKEAIEGYLEVKAGIDEEAQEIIVEEVTEESIVKGLPKIAVSQSEREKIKRSVREMKNGDFVSLDGHNDTDS